MNLPSLNVAENNKGAAAPLFFVRHSTNRRCPAADCLRGKVSAEEWGVRVKLAACYRLVDQYGMTDLIYNHITSRIPGTEHLLINLYGLLYKEITASSLVKIDVEGNILAKPDTDYDINKHGMTYPPGTKITSIRGS